MFSAIVVMLIVSCAIVLGGEHRPPVLCLPYERPFWLRTALAILAGAFAFLLGLYLFILGTAFFCATTGLDDFDEKKLRLIARLIMVGGIVFAFMVALAATYCQERFFAAQEPK